MKTDPTRRAMLAASIASILGLGLVAAPGCGGGDPAGSAATTITDPALKEENKEGETIPLKKGAARKR